MSEIQTISVVVAAVSVAAFVVNSILTGRREEKRSQQTLDTRQAQLLMSLYQRWSEYEFQEAWEDVVRVWNWSDYDDWAAKYSLQANPAEYKKLSILVNFFEGLGVLIKRGFLDASLVDDLMSMYIVSYWQKTEPLWNEVRVRLNSPTAAEFNEYLYDVIHKIWIQQHPETPNPNVVAST